MDNNGRRVRGTKDEKLKVEEILAPFKVNNPEMFKSYLKEIGQDLANRTDNPMKGITKLTFSTYYHLPGLISERLFAVMTKDDDKEYINVKEFIKGLTVLFCEDYTKISKLIFNFYDFDKDGIITREDIRVVLSYISLNKNEEDGVDLIGYIARVNSQEELHEMLDKCFNDQNEKEQVLDYKAFCNVIENNNSDVYLMILLFLYENKPFSKLGLAEYEKQFQIKSPNINEKKKSMNLQMVIASPSKTTTFSPYKRFNQQNQRKTTLTEESIDRDKILRRTRGGNVDDYSSGKSQKNVVNLIQAVPDIKPFTANNNDNENEEEEEEEVDDIGYNKGASKVNFRDRKISEQPQSISNTLTTPVLRKQKSNLKELNKKEVRVIEQYQDMKILPSFMKKRKSLNYEKDDDSNSEEGDISSHLAGRINEDPNENKDDIDSDSNAEEEIEKNIIKHEGYLYKYSNDKLKKIWFKLFGKDLYFYKKSTSDVHNGLHNLSGVFLQEEPKVTFCEIEYFAFSIEYPKKKRIYYVEKEDEYKKWIDKLKKVTGFTEVESLYTIGRKIGNGKFGLIKSGMNNTTGKRVAIKIMAKKNMSQQDLQLVRTEIEILKICQHPNIIRLYEVFEDVASFHIIMEYCAGGDLYSYLEERDFQLNEKHACNIIHKMCTAIYYIHSYGVTHRDLKPENVLMTNKTDESDIRILDFGLSKIIGPDEKCTEPYGTLSYVAPEVLLEQPYSRAVDLWSIGIITYLALSGSLPFDHPTNDELIAKQTISDKQSYKSNVWKDISPEAKNFIDLLLEKDPEKRMNIKDALEHKWFQKHFKTVSENRRLSIDNKISTFQLYSSTNDSRLTNK